MTGAAGIDGVVFDLDGVLLDSEGAWDAARRTVAAEHGGRWRDGATEAMQGMSAPEWAQYLHEVIGVPLEESRIVDLVVTELLRHYETGLPLLPGARQCVGDLGARWPLGLASSANRVVIERVLELAGLIGAFEVTVSSQEVAHGKPAPDVYLEALHRLGIAPDRAVAVEDSANGIRSAAGAGMRVIAVPRAEFRPPKDLLDRTWLVLDSLEELTAELLVTLGAETHEHLDRLVDEEEVESFPASDPHADWAGPAD